MNAIYDFFRQRASFANLFCLGLVFLAMTEPSFAQDFSRMETFLKTISTTITGPIGVTICCIAVMAVGFVFMTGRMDWMFAASILMGIAIVYGASKFITTLA